MLSDLNPDFQDLIKSLTDQNVDFLIVGAHALAYHGVSRFTQDLDIWMRRTQENARKLQMALADFGLPISDADIVQLVVPRKFLRFGNAPVRIEILNFLDGCEFDTAAARAIHDRLGEVDVAILGLKDYVLTKLASGRPKDTLDLAMLRSAIGHLPGDDPLNRGEND